MKWLASATVMAVVVACGGCSALDSLTSTTCYATVGRDALVAGAAAISSATGGDEPVLYVPDCDDYSTSSITYPGLSKEAVAKRIASLPYCTERSQAAYSAKPQTWWRCNSSGSPLNVSIDPDHIPVRVGVRVGS